MFLKNTAGQFVTFVMINVTTGAPVTGITPTCRRCIDGTFGAGGGTVTEDGSLGFYKYAMAQADTNGNDIGLRFTGTGAIDTVLNFVTTTANPYDAVRFGLSALPNANAEAAGGLYTRGTGAGQINQAANGQIDANGVTLAGQTITAAAGVTFPASIASPTNITAGTITTATNLTTNNDKTGYALSGAGVTAVQSGLATPTNITAGTITTVTNLTNAATSGDLTATMKTSVTTAATAATPTAAAVTGNVGGNVTGTVGSVVTKTGYALTSAYDYATGTVAMTESYAANGAAPTPIQATYAIHQMLMDFAIASTSLTVKKLDNTATAFVVTLDSATVPTSAVRV